MALVLCLDDDESVAKLVADVVRFCQHTPVVEMSSIDAVSRHLRNADLLAVLADYMMPQMDGLEVLDVFRAERPDVRRVLITAAPTQEEVRRAEREGLVQMVIAKPPNISDIKLALAWL